MRKVIEKFEHSQGKNCGSTSLRNVARFYENREQEHIIFGLASGILFFYFKGGTPSVAIGGRNPTLVDDFFDNIGIQKNWLSFSYFPQKEIIDFINAGIPVIARTDLYYLSYYPGRVHFPGHEVVIIGYEYNKSNLHFLVSDSSFDDIKSVPEDELARAMDPQEYPFPFVRLENFLMPVEPFKVKFDEESIKKSIAKVIQRFRGGLLEFIGLDGIKKFSDELDQWFLYDDSGWVLRFAYQVIEKRGTGGGLFRFMYSDFLREAGDLLKIKALNEASEIIRESAESWRTIAYKFKEFSENIKAGERIQKSEIENSKKISQKIYFLEKEAFDKLSELLRL